MPGGSAVSVQTAVSSMSRRSFALFRNFFHREARTRYLGSGTGLAWALLHPLALLAVYHFVVSMVIRAGGYQGRSFLVLVAIALWPWLAAQEGLQRAMVGPQIGVRAGFP